MIWKDWMCQTVCEELNVKQCVVTYRTPAGRKLRYVYSRVG